MKEIRDYASGDAKGAVRKYWDYGSKFYDTAPGLGSEAEKSVWRDELILEIGPEPKKILDVGTGTGFMSLLLAEMGHRATGVDFSDMMLETARKKATAQRSSVEILKGDVEELPFENDSYDGVVARYILWTLTDPEKALREWMRVVKPGGRVVIIDGLWETRGFFQTFCKINLQIHRRLKFGKSLYTDMYSAELSEQLPHPQGVEQGQVVGYMTRAGLAGVSVRDLERVRRVQRRNLPWHLKRAYDHPTFLASGTTPQA